MAEFQQAGILKDVIKNSIQKSRQEDLPETLHMGLRSGQPEKIIIMEGHRPLLYLIRGRRIPSVSSRFSVDRDFRQLDGFRGEGNQFLVLAGRPGLALSAGSILFFVRFREHLHFR